MNKSISVAGLSTFALVLLISGAIDSVRNLPATALFGSALPFFFVMSAIFFLIPTALVSAELSSAWHDKGGIYHWVRTAFGEKTGFLAVWLQWINTMVWFPTILSFIAGTLAYLINPAFAQHKIYLVTVILMVFWSVTWISIKGFSLSVRFSNMCTMVGMVLPMILIITLGVAWILAGKPLAISFTSVDVFPSLKHMNNWISLTAIMSAFLGMELATVHVRQVRDPQKTFPRSLGFASMMILITMLFGALTIAFIVPEKQINLVNGVMQTFADFFAVYHVTFIVPIIAVMILLGSLGSIVSWVISPAKGLLQAAEMGYLPGFLTKLNDKGIASRLLIAQALLVSAVCLAFLLMPSVNGSYWLLTDLSTQLYMLMYVLMFLAALCLRHQLPHHRRMFEIPGGKVGMWIVSGLGLMGCFVTLGVGFIPPDTINVGGVRHYEIVFISGMIAMILPVLLFYFYRKWNARSDVTLR